MTQGLAIEMFKNEHEKEVEAHKRIKRQIINHGKAEIHRRDYFFCGCGFTYAETDLNEDQIALDEVKEETKNEENSDPV